MTSVSVDAQTWVFPPPGLATPPVAPSTEIGPVHLGDSMILQWSPATEPTIAMTCLSEYGSTTRSTISQLGSTPLKFEFLTAQAVVNSSDRVFCHFWFNPSVVGNSIQWELVNQPAQEAITWTAVSQTAATATSTNLISSSSSSSSSASVTPLITTTPKPSTSPGLSNGAKIAIGVGFSLVAVLIAITVFLTLLIRQRRNNQVVSTSEQISGTELKANLTRESGSRIYSGQKSELDGSSVAYELPS